MAGTSVKELRMKEKVLAMASREKATVGELYGAIGQLQREMEIAKSRRCNGLPADEVMGAAASKA